MQLNRLALVALGAVSCVHAFRDTSPFFFFSTSEFETSSQQLQSGYSILDSIANKLSSCPSDYYILVSQPGVHATDYNSKWCAPRLRERVLKRDPAIQSSFTVSEVVGEVEVQHLEDSLKASCGASVLEVDGQSGTLPPSSQYENRPQIIKVEFASPPSGDGRADQLVTNDELLASIIDLLPTSDYTVIYTTSPRGDGTFPAVAINPPKQSPKAQPDPVLVQQKRSIARDGNNDGVDSNEALFEKYQFLSAGIFMGLLVGLLFLTILYFGFSALSSLQVSYSSFAKESGPGTAKKQQ